MKYEIEIDNVPEGWEPVRYGVPKWGEYYVSDGRVCGCVGQQDFPEMVVSRKWTAPDWMLPGWICRDALGNWYWSESEPSRNSGYWAFGSDWMNLRLIRWSPPEYLDWTSSKRKVG